MGKRLTPEDAARGKRLRSIRDSLGLTQEEMVPLLNAEAERRHLTVRYRYYTVSRIESGSIGFEDAAVWLSLDPERKGPDLRWEWFVFGDRRVGKMRPRPGPTASGAETERKRA